jgi:hypothetical protein
LSAAFCVAAPCCLTRLIGFDDVASLFPNAALASGAIKLKLLVFCLVPRLYLGPRLTSRTPDFTCRCPHLTKLTSLAAVTGTARPQRQLFSCLQARPAQRPRLAGPHRLPVPRQDLPSPIVWQQGALGLVILQPCLGTHQGTGAHHLSLFQTVLLKHRAVEPMPVLAAAAAGTARCRRCALCLPAFQTVQVAYKKAHPPAPLLQTTIMQQQQQQPARPGGQAAQPGQASVPMAMPMPFPMIQNINTLSELRWAATGA